MAALEKMPRHPRLYRRNGTYYHRAAIPKDIAKTYPKSEETFSLKTKDLQEALRLVRIAAVEVDQRFADHRRRANRPTQLELTSEQLQLIHNVYHRHLLEEDEEIRTEGFAGYTAAKSFDDAKGLNDDLAEDTREKYARGEVDDFIWGEAEDVLTWDGIDIDLDPSSPSWNRLARTLQEAYLRAAEDIQKRYQGKIVGTPAEPSGAPSVSPTGPLLSLLFAARVEEAERTVGWSPKLIDDYQVWTNLFIELKGDRPILEYRKSDARDFKNMLMDLPSNRNKHRQTKGLSAFEAIEAAKAHDLPTLSVSTINKALGRMQAIWKWADKQLDEEVSDIFGPMKLASKSNARGEADPFSPAQLQIIFNSPLFTGCRSKRFRTEPGDTDMSGTSWYWLPLLGLWTGARLNELCQLNVEDVVEEDGIGFLRLHEGDETQRIKGGKKRNVPLHPELERLGFPAFVDAQRRKSLNRVFPDLKISAKGYYSDRPSKDFSAYISKLGAKTDKTSFHSFRHNFKDACRHAGVNPDINDILLGHALPGMAGRYGDGKVPLSRLYEAVCKIDYTGLSLQHIKCFTP
ncbi:Phage integrase family protein [Roseovarius gaetbuli]|uniref:Phage integrase family protein n=1 Tax=Roseovarius gaetbuli TaxID=1356575 RepID=A0A1X7ACU1_9RHOB|nr:site-specific integrase [Roseovarius gaetbuli]SLN76017.1 Phage integrase family protein [Roseovarius gaetbuli]